MLQFMLDTNICIYVIKNCPPVLRQWFNLLAEQSVKSIRSEHVD
jgi:tRNA(fMet)-specific endonuclease VapC